MKIYTKTGDSGFTHRPGGHRIRKSDFRVTAVGAVDELNAHIGLCLAAADADRHGEVHAALEPVQAELFIAGALLAAAGTGDAPNVSLDETAVGRIEDRIDGICTNLPVLEHFILPRGCETACRLHVARTVCRRAERAVVAAAEVESRIPRVIFSYLNRLSDLLFVLARLANHQTGAGEVVWQAPS